MTVYNLRLYTFLALPVPSREKFKLYFSLAISANFYTIPRGPIHKGSHEGDDIDDIPELSNLFSLDEQQHAMAKVSFYICALEYIVG